MLQETAPPSTHSAFSGHHLPFVGFTFSQNCALSDQAELCTLTAAGTGSEGGGAQGDELDALAARAYEKRILKLEQENKEISRKLVGKRVTSSYFTFLYVSLLYSCRSDQCVRGVADVRWGIRTQDMDGICI